MSTARGRFRKETTLPENSALPFRDPVAFLDQEIERGQERERLRLEAERVARRLGVLRYDPSLIALYGSPAPLE